MSGTYSNWRNGSDAPPPFAHGSNEFGPCGVAALSTAAEAELAAAGLTTASARHAIISESSTEVHLFVRAANLRERPGKPRPPVSLIAI